jgi:predicted dehydrogenase
MDPPIDCNETRPVYEDGPAEPMPEWMPEPMQRRYNSFINFYIHQVNLLRYLIGEDYRVIYVDPGQKIMVAVSDSGVTCTLEMASYGLRNMWQEFYKICFEGGKIDLQIPAPLARQRPGNVCIYKTSGFGGSSEPQTIESFLPQKWSFLEQARHFVECLRGGAPTISPTSDAIKDLEVSEQYIRCLMASGGEQIGD